MRKEELKELLLKSLTDDISNSERELIELEALEEKSFGDGFRERVLSSIDGPYVFSFLSYNLSAAFDRIFNRVLLTGALAIIALLLSIFISQGSLSYDTLIGIDSSVDDGLLSLLIE